MADVSGLAGAYGAAAGAQSLEDLLRMRLARQAEQRAQSQQLIDLQNARAQQEIQRQQAADVNRRHGLDLRQRQTEFQAGEPGRLADVAYTGALAKESEGRMADREQQRGIIEGLLQDPATAGAARRVHGGLSEVDPALEQERELERIAATGREQRLTRQTPSVSQQIISTGGVGGAGGGTVPAAARNRAMQFAPVIDAVQTIRENLTPSSARVIGPVVGRAANMARDVGALPNILRNADQIFGVEPFSDQEIQQVLNLSQSVRQLSNQLLYIRTGAQINESEARRLQAEMPGLGMDLQEFNTRLNLSEENILAYWRALQSGAVQWDPTARLPDGTPVGEFDPSVLVPESGSPEAPAESAMPQLQWNGQEWVLVE